MNSDFCPPAANTHVEPTDCTNTHPPEGDPKHFSKPDNTVLLNQTMEMTLSDPTEIVTVESKVRRMDHPSRAKDKKKKKKKSKQTCGSDKADKQVKDGAHSRKSQVETTDAEEPKSQSLNVLNANVSKKSKKRSKIKLKSRQTEDPETCDVVSLNLDEDFSDPAANVSNICVSRTSLSGGEGAEEGKSNITCRRSKDRGKTVSASRNTFVNWPLLVGRPGGHFELVQRDHVTEPDSLVNVHQIRRQTFIISDQSDHSSPTASPAASQTTSCSSQSDAWPTRRLQRRCESSSQADQELAAPSVPPNPKKNGGNEKKPFDKKEAIQKRQSVCEKEKETEGSCLGNEKLRCSEKAQIVFDNLNDTDIESEMVGRSLSDRGEEAGSSQQFYGMDLDMLKLQIPSEPRSLRSTFVIHRLDDPLDSRQAVPSDVSSHTRSPRDELEDFGDMLMDERPPWLNAEAASSFSTPGRKTTDSALLNVESAAEATPGGPHLRICSHRLGFTGTNNLSYSCFLTLKPRQS